MIHFAFDLRYHFDDDDRYYSIRYFEHDVHSDEIATSVGGVKPGTGIVFVGIAGRSDVDGELNVDE